MLKYLLKRTLLAIPTLIAISMVIYLVLSLAPGDPLGELANSPSITAQVRENIRRALGLDQPIYIRYVKWATAFLTGNMGYSFVSPVPVSELIWQRLPTTLWIVGSAYICAILVAFPLGVLSALKRYSWIDQLVTTFAFAGFSIPPFFTGLLFILLFSVMLGWLPFIYDSTLVVNSLGSLWQQIKQSIMPVAVLTLFQTAVLMRYIRAAVIEQLNLDYVRTAYAKGLSSWQVIIRHVLRNALIPVVTLIALDMPAVFTGALVTEQVFRVPGIGSLLIDSINRKDTPVVMSITFIYAILIVLFNLVADLLYSVLDPRIRY
ncbi:ABC transporter, permease protein [Synechococcus sp. PCC 7335]|uniref:ABC transporter permease n=1 Tax=Synechococcus sp. (strain ATCC 29403 / PCC 7335) TaxID=91464 RepID=UPI00017ED5B8|nr:ABC transporter permease [Synechococcus sp. PCC 7335]EDX85330.1 ABC transporter, permease protein [Synechococcus sp. PCC 7335]